MNLNKKGFSYLGLGIILSFAFLSMMYLFTSVFIFEVGDEYIISPSVEIFAETATQLDLDSQTLNTINSIDENYQSLEIPYDMGFIILLVFSVIISFYTSFQARALGHGSFYGLLTIGMVFFLFMFGFVEILTNWFYDNMVFGFLEFDITNKAPLMYAFLQNSALYSFVWAMALILINKLDLGMNVFNKQDGGFEE